MDRTCETCKYYVLRHCGGYGCWNKKSEYFGDNPKPEHTCKDWDSIKEELNRVGKAFADGVHEGITKDPGITEIIFHGQPLQKYLTEQWKRIILGLLEEEERYDG